MSPSKPLLAKDVLILGSVSAGVVVMIFYMIPRTFPRYTNASSIPDIVFRQQTRLRGRIVQVNDSDNVRLFHRPWWYLTSTQRALTQQRLSDHTINIRLAGIDAPECAHFGKPAQPFSQEAKTYLTQVSLNRYTRIQLHRRDQYGRAVASVWVWTLLGWQHVALSMIKAGYATVYTSAGAEYGMYLKQFQEAEKKARKQKRGMWQQLQNNSYISPADYKRGVLPRSRKETTKGWQKWWQKWK